MGERPARACGGTRGRFNAHGRSPAVGPSRWWFGCGRSGGGVVGQRAPSRTVRWRELPPGHHVIDGVGPHVCRRPRGGGRVGGSGRWGPTASGGHHVDTCWDAGGGDGGPLSSSPLWVGTWSGGARGVGAGDVVPANMRSFARGIPTPITGIKTQTVVQLMALDYS